MSRSGGLTAFSLKRPVTVFVICVTALVIGGIAARNIPLELIPSGFTSPSMQVRVPWRDAPPQEVFEKIVRPLEEELSTVGGLKRVSSASFRNGGRVFLRFRPGADMDIAYRQVRDRVERARPRLPNDVGQIIVRKRDGASLPVAVIGLVVDPSVADPYQLIRREILLPLSRIDGVATVEADGLEEQELVIELDRDRAEAAGLSLYDLSRELRGDDFSLPSGEVRRGDSKLLLRTLARHESLDSLRRRPVAPDRSLGDVAEIGLQRPARGWRVRVNREPAYALEVVKEGQANTMEVTRRVGAALDKIRENPRLSGFELKLIFDQGDVIVESLETVLDSGAVGAVFAIAVLLFFLRRVRLTLIITLSIPLSLLIGLTVMFFAGETLNLLTLLALMICVGLLVDNSVVVAENIHRLHREGVGRAEACIRGAREVSLAIVLATLTTILVFLPVSLVEGSGQFFLMRLAIPISVSLAASLVVALVFVPLAVSLTLGSERRLHLNLDRVHRLADRSLGRAYEASFGRLSALYERVLARALSRRLESLILLALLFAVTGAVAFGNTEIVESAEQDQRSFRLELDLPPTNSLQESSDFMERVEAVLAEARERYALEGYLVVFTPEWAQVEGWLTEESPIGAREVRTAVMDALPEAPGVRYYTGNQQEQQDDPSSQAVWSLVLEGDDPRGLAEAGARLEESLLRVEGVVGAKRSDERAPNEVALVVDRARAQRRDINPQVVAGVVALALRGDSLPRFSTPDGELPVRIRYRPEDRGGLEDLADLSVPTREGGAVRLSSLTDLRYLASEPVIWRVDKRMSQSLTLELAPDSEDETRERLDALVGGLELPEGISRRSFGGGSPPDDELAAMRFALLMSIVFIYLLMGFLFESFLLPLSVILTIPLASIGVGWVHFLLGRDLDMLGLVGCVLLVGVVVNNGIVLIDCVHSLRREGHARREALILAARRRFRPILMTAGTTVCGMVPLALGEPTSIGLSYTSFGLTLIGGLLASTALTVLVVPVFYTLIDDAREAALQVLADAFRSPPGEPRTDPGL